MLCFMFQATSKLLKAYPDKQRNQVLDILFKVQVCAMLYTTDFIVQALLINRINVTASKGPNSWPRVPEGYLKFSRQVFVDDYHSNMYLHLSVTKPTC